MSVALISLTSPSSMAAKYTGTDPSGLPTRSEIHSWTTAIEALTSSALTLRAAALGLDEAADTYVQQISSPGGAPWDGNAADAARAAAYRDRGVVYGATDHLREIAKLADLGAQSVHLARTLALDAIADSEADGFRVADNLTVVDVRGFLPSAALYTARKALADMHSGVIAMRAGALVAEDADVGAKLDANAVALRDMIPTDWTSSGEPRSGSIQTVDYATYPEGPPALPEGPFDAQSVRDANDVHGIVDPLPPGRQPGVKTLPTPEAIQGLYGQLTANSVPGPPSAYPGQWRLLGDGTKIGLRSTSKSGGPTVDIFYPDGTENKVHLQEVPKKPEPVPEPAPVPVPVALPAPATADDVGVLGVVAGIGAAILVGAEELGSLIFSP